VPNREITGIILFDNSGSVKFYLDPTPESNEEYRRRTEEYQDLGGGMINVARLYSAPTGEAAGHTDLLSVALHEIGHALGMSAANLSFIQNAQRGTIRISDALPSAGTIIPLFYDRQDVWIDVMRHAVSINGSFFNAHRMVLQYVLDAYYLAYPRIEQETALVAETVR
jgi:hypothetical protein